MDGYYSYGTLDADINDMINSLESLEKNVEGPVTQALEQGAEMIVNAQKALVPVGKTGKLRDSIERWKAYRNKKGRITVRCGIDFHKHPKELFPAIANEYGRVGGTDKNGKKVGKMKARPFIRAGFDARKDAASEVVVNAFNDFVEKEWNK